jgi:hypothetical protein
VAMDEGTRKTTLVTYQGRKQEEITHAFLGELATTGMLIHLQALLLARFLRGDIDVPMEMNRCWSWSAMTFRQPTREARVGCAASPERVWTTAKGPELGFRVHSGSRAVDEA